MTLKTSVVRVLSVRDRKIRRGWFVTRRAVCFTVIGVVEGNSKRLHRRHFLMALSAIPERIRAKGLIAVMAGCSIVYAARMHADIDCGHRIS
jgi:uncharacterized protein YjeT (DUF2065 family)